MSQSQQASGNILFCHRNNRLWVTSLAASAILVLVLAVWLAFEDGKLKGFKRDTPTTIAGANGTNSGMNTMSNVQQVAFNGLVPQPQNSFAAQNSFAPQNGPGQQPFDAISSVPVAAAAPVAISPIGGADTAVHLQSSFNHVSELMRPRVVSINAIRPTPKRPLQAIAAGPTFVDPFDGVPDKVIAGVAMESVGSGVIVDAAGYVVTNDHVVHGATKIMVTLFHQPQPVAAELVATDSRRDLALLKISGPGPFPAAKLSNSNNVEVGDWVLAVGNPFGLGHSVTAGIVSSRRSSVVIGGVEYKSLLQTDAPINQGSSGGPLVNLQGEIVGINTAIYAPTGVFNGTGFAIPSNQVGSFLSRTIDTQAPARAANQAPAGPMAPVASPRPTKLGIQGTDLSAPLATKLGLQNTQGLFVNSVDPGSTAERAGIRRGDVVIGLAGVPVQNSASLRATLNSLPLGQNTTIVAIRDRETLTKNLTVGVTDRQ